MDLGAQGSSFKGQIGIIYIQNQRHLATRINSFGSVSFHTKFHSWLPVPEMLEWSEYCASFPPPVGPVDHELLVPGAVASCLTSPSLFFCFLTIMDGMTSVLRQQNGLSREVVHCPQGFSRQDWVQPGGTRGDLTADCSEQELPWDDLRDPFRPHLPRDAIV